MFCSIQRCCKCTQYRSLSKVLFGQSRRSILALLYGHADEQFYLREIARRAGTGIGATQRELKLFVIGDEREFADWVNNGWLVAHKSSKQEIGNLLGIMARDLKDSQAKDVSDDWRFALA